VRAASVEDFTADPRGHEKRWGPTGSRVSATLRQLSGTSGATLRQLCGKGRRVYFVDMEHTTGSGHREDLVVDGDPVGLVVFWWPGHSTQAAWPPSSHGTPVLSTSPRYQIPPDPVEGEPTEPTEITTAVPCTDRHRTNPHLRPETCPFATDRVVRHMHLKRAAHPRPDRARSSIEEDRRVHTCGPEPRGGLL
jgi:hypothetical protein